MNALYRALSAFLLLAGAAVVAAMVWQGLAPPGGDTPAARVQSESRAKARDGQDKPKPRKAGIEIINGNPDATGVQVGQRAPEITGETIDGEQMALSEFRGKVVLLDFWGNW